MFTVDITKKLKNKRQFSERRFFFKEAQSNPCLNILENQGLFVVTKKIKERAQVL